MMQKTQAPGSQLRSQSAQSSKPQKPQKRKTEYGQQLAEKQVAKKIYGVRERQFSNYYKKAIRTEGDTGQVIQQMLEMRLDNVIFRLGFAISRPMARQLVSHGMFLVNGKKVNIPSYQVSVKDEITIKENKSGKKIFADLDERLEKFQAPSWIVLDKKERKGKVTAKPSGNELENIFNPRLIVEFYSR